MFYVIKIITLGWFKMIEINKKLSFGYNSPPLIIAEISGNHNQNKNYH